MHSPRLRTVDAAE